MKKVLLSLAAVGTAMSANAQLLNYGFETSDILPGEIVAENWYAYDEATGETKYENFVNCQYNWQAEGKGIDASTGLWVYTDVAASGTWERVIAFLNTGVQENKSYRISLYVKGEGQFNVGILKGCFNHDKALLAGNGSTFVDQTKSFTAANNDEFVRYSYVVWSPSRAIMQDQKSDFADDQYWNQDFLRLSFNGTGEYSVDNVKIEESTVENIACNGNAIRVDFGYATNGASLADGSVFKLDPSCASVTVDGEPATVDAIEIKSDGKLYIFLTEEFSIGEESQVAVSFTNPGDLKYSSNVAPECFDNPNCAVYNFENEQGFYDSDLYAVSSEWEEAVLVSSNPANNSFEWDGDLNTFTFTFDKPVYANAPENGKPIATLSGQGINEELVLEEFEGCQTTLTFKRPAGAADFANGEYTISLDNVSNAKDMATTTPFEVVFEVGRVTVGYTEYTDVMSVWIEGDANAPQPSNGWIAYYDGAENTDGSQTRVGNIITNGKGVGYYFAQRGGSVGSQLTYGEKEDAPLTLPEGNVQLSIYFTIWQSGSSTLSYKLVKKDNPEEVVASGSVVTEAVTSGFGATMTSIPGAAVKLPGTVAGDYILTLETAAGWAGTMVYGFDVKTYKLVGHVPDPVIIIDESFASVEANAVPAAGTGWSVYENNTLLAKGQNQSGHTRMMSISNCTGLSLGFYNRCLGGDEKAYYMTYGEPAPEGQEEAEPELILENAKYSFSWYAVNWKKTEQTYYFQLINAETGEVEYEMDPVKVTATVEGNTQSADAVQILFNYTPQGGKYIMKWWMTNESVIGKIRVEKMGSIAVYWKNRLNNDGLAAAVAERENAADDEFAGATRDNLDAVIAKNTNPSDYHTGDDYQAAIDECLAAAKAMAARRAAIAAFKTDIVTLAEKLATIDAKYEALDIIPELKDIVAKYSEVDPSTLEDEELLSVQGKITNGIDAVSNVIKAVDNLITKQIQNLLEAIAVYGEELDDEFCLGWISKGESALTDDQEIAENLKLILTACIYDSIASGYDFKVFDEEMQDFYGDSIDITGYVANNMLYTINAQKNYVASEANATFPGWNITEGTVSNVWWWESALAISETNPAVDASIRNNPSEGFKVNQELTNLPVGVYTLVMKTADCSNVADVSTSYTKKDEEKPWSESVVYATVGESQTSTEANYGSGKTWRNASETYLPNIQAAATEEYTVTMTIGADINCTNDASQVDDTKLFMTGKIDGFDYAAAAAALLNKVPNDLKGVQRADAPVAVEYINLAGQSSSAEGAVLKVEKYSDGYTIVRKVINK